MTGRLAEQTTTKSREEATSKRVKRSETWRRAKWTTTVWGWVGSTGHEEGSETD